MTPDVVVDIGNTRMKWAKCQPKSAVRGCVALPLNDERDWGEQVIADEIEPHGTWVIASVNPAHVHALASWIHSLGGTYVHLQKHTDLPIVVDVEEPAAVGIDRLLGAVAAKAMVPPGTPAITIDVGTAMTVNLLDEQGRFRGGAIMPGPRLMGVALNQNTAKLPLVEIRTVAASHPPARNTTDAIKTGINAALTGGAGLLYSRLASQCSVRPWVILTGGGVGDPSAFQFPGAGKVLAVPFLNLEGIRIAAEALP